MISENAIEIKGLCKSYKNFTLDHINLTLPRGCIMGLIGENGAGKSTIIKLMLDMIKRDSGTVTLLGKDNKDMFNITKEDIGVVLDEVGIPGCLNARQVGRIMKNSYRNWDESIYSKYLLLRLLNTTIFNSHILQYNSISYVEINWLLFPYSPAIRS